MKLLIFTYIILRSTVANADDNLRSTFLSMAQGSAPSASASQTYATETQIEDVIVSVKANFNLAHGSVGRDCIRYKNDLNSLLDDIHTNILRQKVQYLSDVRLRLLIPALYAMHSMFIQDHEAGYQSLAEVGGKTCPLQNRQATKNSFNELMSLIAAFSRESLGNPGILGFDRMMTRLLVMSDQHEIYQSHVELGFVLISIATSIIFWEYAPIAVAKVVQPLLASRQLVVPNYLISGVRLSAIVGENLGFLFLDKFLFPNNELQISDSTDNWAAQLLAVESLIHSPLDSPRLYTTFLAQVQLQLGTLFRPWIHRHINDLQNLEDFRFGPRP